MGEAKTLISLIFPVLNEEAVLPHLFAKIEERERLLSEYEFELIFVDDGSTDASVRLLQEYAEKRERIKVVVLSRNFGQQFALFAGLSRTAGQAAILLDADLQDPPELLPEILSAYKEGFDIVSTIKISRKGNLLRRFFYFAYYRVARWTSQTEVVLDSGDFGLLSRRVIDVIKELPERQLYLRGLRSWAGFRQKVISFHRPDREFGESGYSTTKLISLALDGILSFSILPLRAASLLGILTILTSFLFFCYALYVKWTYGNSPIGFTALVGLLLFTSGVQLLSLGIIGEYIGRIYGEVKRRPRYLVREEFGSEESLPKISVSE